MSLKVVTIEKALRKQGIVPELIIFSLLLWDTTFIFKFLAAKFYGLNSKIRKHWLLKIEMAWLILIDIEYVNGIDKGPTKKKGLNSFQM